MSRSPVVSWREALCDSELDTMAKCVGFVISRYMNAAGVGYPGKETIRRGASVKSVRTVDEAVGRIKAAGFLDVRVSKGGRAKDGRGIPNLYRVTLPTPQPTAGLTPHEDAGITPQTSTGFEADNPANIDAEPRSGTAKNPAARRGGSSNRNRKATSAAADNATPWIPELWRYTGVRLVNGSHSRQHVYDPLGTEKPPADWTRPKPTPGEVFAARKERGLA
jgi:hypothetical protein